MTIERMTAIEYQEALARGELSSRRPRRGKYGVSDRRQRTFDNLVFASRLEMQRYQTLVYRQGLGAVARFIPQPRFELGVPENVYVADFKVWGRDGRWWVEDVKGAMTAKFKRDVKLWRAYGPCDLVIVTRGKRNKGSVHGFAWLEEIVPGGAGWR